MGGVAPAIAGFVIAVGCKAPLPLLTAGREAVARPFGAVTAAGTVATGGIAMPCLAGPAGVVVLGSGATTSR